MAHLTQAWVTSKVTRRTFGGELSKLFEFVEELCSVFMNDYAAPEIWDGGQQIERYFPSGDSC